MEWSTVDLGYGLRQFLRYAFDMDSFGGRLMLQWFVCLLQAHYVHLGYDLQRYLCGSYSLVLARRVFEDVPVDATRFESGSARERVENFTGFMLGRETDDAFLETDAFLHMLKACGSRR